MNKKISLSLALTLAILFSASCTSKKLPTTNLTITKQDGTTINVNVEIASTPEQRNFGFMERKKIPDGTGMIFVFDHDQILSFCMKNTPHPLSIAYIDSNGKIRNLYDMTPFSLSPIESTVSVRYALEVPQGWFSKNEITIGSTVDLSPLKNF